MVQDQVLHKCNNGKKKNKGTKKVPQRGLGVAQLERLRLEEQKNLHNSFSSSSSSSTNPFPPSLHLLPSHTPPVSPPPPIFQLKPPNSLLFSSSSEWRSPHLSYRRNQQLHRSSGSGYSPSNLEPPSNQIVSRDNTSFPASSFADEREMVGTRRSLPFNLDPIANPLRCKFPPSSNLLEPNITLSRRNYFDEIDFDSKTTISSTRISNDRKQIETHKKYDGGFLTLGIPTSQSVPAPPLHVYTESSFNSSHGNDDEYGPSLTRSQTLYSFMPLSGRICEKPRKEWTPPVHDALDLNLKL